MKHIILLLLPLSLLSQSIDELKPWERLGLTSREYHECQLRGFPEDSIKFILPLGVGPIVYFTKPWEDLNITRDAWIDYHRRGYTDTMIEAELRKDITVQPLSKSTLAKLDFEANEQSESNRLKLQSFALPGYIQLTKCPYKTVKIKGSIMAGMVLITAGATVAWSARDGYFVPVPILFILIPDMFWSYFNVKKLGMF